MTLKLNMRLLLIVTITLIAHGVSHGSDRAYEKQWDKGFTHYLVEHDDPFLKALGLGRTLRQKSADQPGPTDHELVDLEKQLFNLLEANPGPNAMRRLFIDLCLPAASDACVRHNIHNRYLSSNSDFMSTYIDLMSVQDHADLVNPFTNVILSVTERKQWLMDQAASAPSTDDNPFHATNQLALAYHDYAKEQPYPPNITDYDERVTEENVHYVLALGTIAAYALPSIEPVVKFCLDVIEQSDDAAIQNCKSTSLRLQQHGTAWIERYRGARLQKMIVEKQWAGTDFATAYGSHFIDQQATSNCQSVVLNEDILATDLVDRYFETLGTKGEISALNLLVRERTTANDDLKELCSYQVMNYPDSNLLAE